MPPPLPSGSSASTPVPNEHFIGSRSRERPSTHLLKLRAQTFKFELDRERQRCAETGESLPAEWAASLERERRELLDQIQHEEVQGEHPPLIPAPSVVQQFEPQACLPLANNAQESEKGRRMVYTIDHSRPRPATTHPESRPVVHIIAKHDRGGHDDSSYSSSLGVRKRENEDHSRPDSRSKSPRPLSALDHSLSRRLLSKPILDDVLGKSSDTPQERPFHDTAPPSSTHLFTPTPISSAKSHNPRMFTPGESGRRSARGWYPSTPRNEHHRQNLYRQALTPTRATFEEQKPRKILIEDEDRPLTHLPSTNPPPTLTAPGTPSLPQPGAHNDQSFGHTPAILKQLDLYLSNTSTRDRLPSPIPTGAIIPKSSKVPGGPRPMIALQIAKICRNLMDVFRDLAKYKQFLSYRDKAAQYLLNFLQTLLDYPQLEERFRTIIFVALLRLSKKSALVPECFSLTDVTRESEWPVTDGHFGEIYKGYFRNKRVCLKVVKMYQKSNRKLLFKAFSREAVLWGQLSHINVLPFYGIYPLGDERHRIGLVSPWMEHGDINDYLAKYPQADRRLLVSDVASGMLYLHNNRVIHGDLKGGNILVTASHRACLADFGLSSVVDSQGLKTPSLSSGSPEGGTVRFQAPELIDPDIVGLRSQASDIYAFALVCYEIFTGNYPFPNIPNNSTVMLKVIAGERPLRPVGALYRNRGLTDRMWGLMEDCWAHNPTHRPTASQIVKIRLPPQSVDQRPPGGWRDQSSRFHAPDGKDHSEKQELSVVETLRILETIGISLFRL